MNKTFFKSLLVVLFFMLISLFAWHKWQQQQQQLPHDIAMGNGRIEADQIDITSKYAGRVAEIFVEEGELVEVKQLLAIMDSVESQASLAQAIAQLAQAQAAVEEGASLIVQRQSESVLAQQELDRVLPLVKTGAMSQNSADQKQSVRNTTIAAVSAAKAHLNTLEQSVNAAKAAVNKIQIQVDETHLMSPVKGRVLYRLAQPSEVLGNGGKVLTLINLQNVYMEVFLPAEQAYRAAIGAEARIKLDIFDVAIPATVSFVSPESQFTPKQVETQNERDKLMFRVKVRIPHALVLQHIEQVKTGVRGVAYIRLAPGNSSEASPWPEFLQKLPDDFLSSENNQH